MVVGGYIDMENKGNKGIMICPLCDREHEILIKERSAVTTIKNLEVKYQERYMYCVDEECEFESGTMLNQNLLNARNEYRKLMGLLTSHDIILIRKMYDLSQVELSKLLGIGEATISRYESKAIQDETYDTILRKIKNDPQFVYEYFIKNRLAFSTERQQEIYANIKSNAQSIGQEYASRRVLESQYVDYMEPSELNGFTMLNIDKIEATITYLAKRVKHLYKVKLMKYLWYIDALNFKERGNSLTGLVYIHRPMGAVPFKHESMLNLHNINTHESYSENFSSKVQILPNNNIKEEILDEAEITVINDVIKKFETYNTQSLVDYMHQEKAYTETQDQQVISYSLAKEIRDFRM